MPPRAALLSSAEGAMAASLDYYEEEEDGSFHQFHAHQVQLASPRREAPSCWVVHNCPSMIDPLWQTTWWLKSFEEQCREHEPIWWPLIHPLTDGGDVAALALGHQLMTTWRWATTISTGAWDVKGCTIDCWSKPLGNVLHQRDEGACADVISYPDELAICQPSRKAWDEVVCPPVSSVPSMPC